MSKYNIVVYGATGFTGQLICKYLSNSPEAKNLSWAIAGRNKNKLTQLSNNFPLKYMYDINYGYRSGINETMKNHLKEIIITGQKTMKEIKACIILIK